MNRPNPNPNQSPKIDLKMPFQIVSILDKGRCLVNGILEIVKCPDCDELIRYGGSFNLSLFELLTENQISTVELIRAEHGTKGANDYYDILVNELVEAHPPIYNIPR